MIRRYFGNLTMYRLILHFLRALVAFAVVFGFFRLLPYSWVDILIQAVLFAGLCWALGMLFARVVRTKANFESSIITGLILACIMGPLSLPGEWATLVVASVAAIASKYVLVHNRSHIFNPAAFGAVISALAIGAPASWWAGNAVLLPVILIGGLLVAVRIRRIHLIVSFFAVYAALFLLLRMFAGEGLAAAGGSFLTALRVSPLLFFAFVMLVEPLTAPQTRRMRIAFGALVAVVLFVLQNYVLSIPYSLELALLAGNVFARVVNPDFRQAFTLRAKELLPANIGNFWFEPVKQFSFKAGQYLEYTLGHPRADVRGLRRYFTIASSPTEPQVLLTTKFADPGSTFKAALRAMEPGDEIIASKVGGDFTLPADEKTKIAFIAGGIGITPYRSMVKYLLDTGGKRDIVLLYGAREEQELMFRDIFDAAHSQFGMKNVYALSDETRTSAEWKGARGLIDEKLIRAEVPDFAERTFYISGPEPMVKAMAKTLAGIGIPASRIVKDYFPGYG